MPDPGFPASLADAWNPGLGVGGQEEKVRMSPPGPTGNEEMDAPGKGSAEVRTLAIKPNLRALP